MKTKRNLLLSLLLCCIMVLGMLPVTALAATADETPQPFSFEVKKTVTKGGSVAPGEETFTFELAYGTVGENAQHSVVFTPDDSVTLADCGIAFTNNTITTNGAGEQTFTLGGTIDPTKVDSAHHWQSSTGNDSVPKHIITLRLTEKNDGKPGWTYSDAERYLTITVQRTGISAEVGLLGNDVYDNNFENIYTNSVADYSFTVKKNVVQGGNVAPGQETFAFELAYGTVGENAQHSVVFTPDDSVTLADCGIAFTNNTITTNGAGEQTFTLGGTIDLSLVNAEHHWQAFQDNSGARKFAISLKLTEKNDGKPGWTYSDADRYLTITVTEDNTISTDVTLLGNDVYDNNFENIYTNSVANYSFTVKKTDADGNPLAGATFSLTGTGNSIGKDFEAVSGADGIATFNVPEGFYTLAEKTAPAGYIKSDKTYGIAIWDGVVHFYNEDAENDNDRYSDYQQVTFINTAQVPQTGDNSMMGLWLALLLVSGVGVAGTTIYGRKKYSAK